MKFINLLFLVMIFSVAAQAAQHPYERARALAASYEKDKLAANALASTLDDYAPHVSHKAAGTSNYREPYRVRDMLQAGDLWFGVLKPQCEYINKEYGKVFLAAQQVNWFDYPEAVQDRWRDSQEKYVTEFPFSLVQRRCREFEDKIQYFLTAPRQVEKYIPHYLEQFEDDLTRAQQSSVGKVNAFADQDASLYNLQFGYYNSLTLLLAWLEDYDPDHPNLAVWKAKTEDLRNGFYSAAQKFHHEVLPKSKLPIDFFSDDTQEQRNQRKKYRYTISANINRQFGYTPLEIRLRDNTVRKVERFLVRNNQLQTEQYTAIAFVAIMQGDGDTQSSHHGWYEKIEKGPEKVYMIKGHDNFGSSTAMQIVTTLDVNKLAAQKKAKADAEFAAQRSSQQEAIKQNVAEEVARAKEKAMAEVEAAKKAALAYEQKVRIQSSEANTQNTKSQENDKQPPDGTAAKLGTFEFSGGSLSPGQSEQPSTNTSVGGIMAVLSSVTSIFMIGAGMLISRDVVLSIAPTSTQSTIRKSVSGISPHASKLGLALMTLGVVLLIDSLLSLSVLGMTFGALVVITGLLLAMEQVLNFNPQQFTGFEDKTQKLQTFIQKYQSQIMMLKQFQTPLGIAALVIGILGLIGLI